VSESVICFLIADNMITFVTHIEVGLFDSCVKCGEGKICNSSYIFVLFVPCSCDTLPIIKQNLQNTVCVT
jgi:uncharacterized protein (DUF983 family)